MTKALSPTALPEGPAPKAPLPPLSEASQVDDEKVENLPSLSPEDFRIYNKLAVMMDAYVK